MFFQINVTPKEKKKTESSKVDIPLIKDFHITLAPFQPQTRIFMETSINAPTECFLHVKNTGNRSLNVTVTKRPPLERNVDLSFTNAMIDANTEATLQICWSPAEAGSWREVLQLTDGRRVKYEIPLVMQAHDPRKKDPKSRRVVRKPLVSKSNTTQQSYPTKNFPVQQKESTFDKKSVAPRSKRTRIDSYLDEPDKENMSKNFENFAESSLMKKQRKEVFNASSIISTETFVLTPVKFNSEKPSKSQSITTNVSETNHVKYSKTTESQNKDYNFSPQESFIVMEERVEMKTLRRETYIKTPKYREMITINEQEEDDQVFDDSLSPVKGKCDFSRLIDNINFTPKEPVTSGSVFEFSPGACSIDGKSDSEPRTNTTFEIVETSDEPPQTEAIVCLPPSPRRKPSTFLKPTRLADNFDALTPITPAPKRKVEFASSSLLSMDCSTFAETPRRFDTSYRHLDSSTAKEILEADMWIKPESIVPLRREKRKEILNETFEFQPRLPEIPSISSGARESCLLEISPPRSHKPTTPGKVYRSTNKVKRTSPIKSGKITKTHENLVKKKQINNSLKNTIPGVRISNLSLVGVTRKRLNQSLTILKESIKLDDPNDFISKFCNPDPFAATMTQDPFLSNTLYYDDKWVHHQELEFKKWLNALMTPHEHLSTDVDTTRVDIGKLWQSSRMQDDVVLAESRESISARIHTNTRLNTLRKAAAMMFRNPEVCNILSRTTVCVEKGILVIRQDRDLHRDIGLQKGILELLLSYNPLWLRIGLETVYAETIPLRSNNDLVGLTRFLVTRFFADPFITRQHSHPTVINMRLPTFTPSLHKFLLKKFLLLVFFLDFAKSNKLIGHDPCLFHKKAPHKDSRSLLLAFSREVLSGIGDITKVLKAYGYIVSYKQTYLDEFDYAVHDMSSDLRDGVRLCRAMELITGDRNLTCQCRVPAISRLQKIHNVSIALKALLDSGYTITGDIDSKTIADGHREKTLSLLWQIIYKFQKPRFEKAASTIQLWWRSKLWYVRVRQLLRNRKTNAACVIQRAWRSHSARMILRDLRNDQQKKLEEMTRAALVIQKHWKLHHAGRKQRIRFLEKRNSVLMIQNWWRRIRETRPFVQELQNQKKAVRVVEKAWKSRKVMIITRLGYQTLRRSCLLIQRRFRAKLKARRVRKSLEELKLACLVLQRRYRARKSMIAALESYQRILASTRILQNWWRSILRMKRDRNAFLLQKYAVRLIEEKWLARRNDQRLEFLAMKRSAIVIQKFWRRHRETKNPVRWFRRQREASIRIESWWRGIIARREFETKRNAARTIQNHWRSAQLTKTYRAEYLMKRSAVLILQKNWRMTRDKRHYWQMKSSILVIETWYESVQLTRALRQDFLSKKRSVRVIETWWSSLQGAKQLRREYLTLKSLVIQVQRKWRARKLAMEFQRKKSAIVKIQSWVRMWQQKRKFQRKLKSAIVVQRHWRGILAGRSAQNEYQRIRRSVIVLQRRWRTRKTRNEFLRTRELVIGIQNRWRSYVARKHFLKMKKSAIVIQNWWRHKNSGRKIRGKYLESRRIVTNLQRRVRQIRIRKNYLRIREAVVKIQRRWRALKIGKKVRRDFENYRKTVILVQKTWRMKRTKKRFDQTRGVIIKMQRIWRAKLSARKVRNDYERMKNATRVIQHRWRRLKQTKEIRKEFLNYRRLVIVVQSTWRMKIAVRRYENLLKATRTIQSHWRAEIEARRCRKNFERIKSATLVIQRRFRANREMEMEKRRYLIAKRSVVLIQRKWRATMEAKRIRDQFTRRKLATIVLQNWWRSVREMRETRDEFWKTRMMIVKVQRRYRANVCAREIRGKYEELRKVVVGIQACWRFILARRAIEELMVRRKIAVRRIEDWWLEMLEMRKIREVEREKMRKLHCAATKIQAIWRGFRVRRVNTKRMSELRVRTENAARQAIPAQTLANRLEDSINVFLFSNDLGRLSMCLSSLDVITRLSPNGCITVCKVGLVDRIYLTLGRSNRSVPWMDACTRATSVLVTLAKYPPTKPYVLKEEYIETLARFLTVTVEKEVPLFLYLSTLIWVLIEDDDYAQALLNDARSVWLINSVYSTIIRKKPKTCPSISKTKDEVMPNSKPDWGLKQRQPRLFNNVLHAITSILQRLNEHKTERSQ